MNKKKNRLLHLWNKFHYGVRYRVELKHFSLLLHFIEKNGVEMEMPLHYLRHSFD